MTKCLPDKTSADLPKNGNLGGCKISFLLSYFSHLTISKKKILLNGMKTCDGVVVNMVLGAATRCPVLMIGKLSFCLDFPPPPQISSPRNQARLLPAQETCRLFVEIKLLILDSLSYKSFSSFLRTGDPI